MKSKNNLSITGFLVSDLTVQASLRYGQFTLVHNFGNGKPPLFLKCTVVGQTARTVLALGLKKGDAVSVTAYLRPDAERVEAVVKRVIRQG